MQQSNDMNRKICWASSVEAWAMFTTLELTSSANFLRQTFRPILA